MRALYERFAPRVYAVVRRIAGDDELARGLCSGGMDPGHPRAPKRSGETRAFPRGSIASGGECGAPGRPQSRGRGRKYEGPALEEAALPPATGDALLKRRLEAALDQLPQGMRQVLILHDVEGYTHDDIGEVLGVTAGTSKSQLFKARAKMRGLLRGIGEVPRIEKGERAWNT